MELSFVLITALVAAVVTAVVTALVVRSLAARAAADARASLAGELSVAIARADDARARLSEAEALAAARGEEVTGLQRRNALLERDATWLSGELAQERQNLEATRALLERTDARLKDSFQALAAEALHANRSAFLDLARTSFEGFRAQAEMQDTARHKALDGLVQPIAETLRQVDTRLHETERERIDAYARLAEQVTQLGSTAQMLSRALRTPAVRGRWGEMQLRRVVEIAGMLLHCDFEEQPSLSGEDGRLRPDMIVHLPGGRQIVIDAKAPLEAFLDAQEATDDETRHARLRLHARHVRDHVDRLASKAYWEQLGNSPEMVVMFLPGETLFSAALQNDLTLVEHGLQQRVVLASPITLIALLTTVAHSWRQEALTDNYREVSRLGKELYDRLVVFVDRFDEIRRRLDGTVQAYNLAAGSFESRVLVSARRLKELEITTAADLPAAEPIDTVPRVLRQAGLMGVPEEAVAPDEPEED
ncbi:MAG: DNA recombination protein RmuC [Vicinamibacterales bacterium]